MKKILLLLLISGYSFCQDSKGVLSTADANLFGVVTDSSYCFLNSILVKKNGSELFFDAFVKHSSYLAGDNYDDRIMSSNGIDIDSSFYTAFTNSIEIHFKNYLISEFGVNEVNIVNDGLGFTVNDNVDYRNVTINGGYYYLDYAVLKENECRYVYRFWGSKAAYDADKPNFYKEKKSYTISESIATSLYDIYLTGFKSYLANEFSVNINNLKLE